MMREVNKCNVSCMTGYIYNHESFLAATATVGYLTFKYGKKTRLIAFAFNRRNQGGEHGTEIEMAVWLYDINPIIQEHNPVIQHISCQEFIFPRAQ